MTERLSDNNPCKSCREDFICEGCEKHSKWLYDVIKKLAEYETAEEEGKLVVLPCDTVYFICDKGTKYAHVSTKSILGIFVCEIDGIDKEGRYWSSREKAEKALKEVKNERH